MWKVIAESESPHLEKFPTTPEGKSLSRMQILCVLRCIRADKVVAAIMDYVAGYVCLLTLLCFDLNYCIFFNT